MLSLLGININYIKIIAIVVLLGVLSTGYFMIKSLRAELEVATANAARLEEVVRNQEQVMTQLRDDITTINRVQANLFSQLNAAQTSARELARRFTQDGAGRERNFAATASRNPSGVETAINRGTRDALRCNEIATGSPLTPDERQGKVQNTICPELVGAR